MKKIIYLVLINTLLIFSCNSYDNEIEYNTESNIWKAVLVEDYIKKHKEKIENFILKYDISEDDDINKNLNILNESIEALQKIQNWEIENQKSEEIIQAIIKRVKIVNDNLKINLEIKKSEFEKKLLKKKENYSKLWIKLSNKIDEINIKIARNVFKDKTVLSLKESKIKQNLIQLNKESIKLKNLWNIEFKSEKEIKDSLIRILTNIKREVNSMKNNMK